MTVKFGTDGWRDTMDGDFTLANVERLAQAYSDYYQNSGAADKGFFIGYDYRANSEIFARRTAEVLAANGCRAILAARACPTQVVSFVVREQSLAGGVMITASHNPPRYNGFKVKEPQGCSSFPETTDGIMTFLDKNPVKKSGGKFELYDPREEFFKYIEARVDFAKIQKSGLRIFIDPLFGSGSGYISGLLARHGIDSLEINAQRDPQFGGFNPEPLAANVPDFMEIIKKSGADFAVGLILDGDADRNGACGSDGQFINSQKVFSILFHHFAENLQQPGKLVHAFNGTRLLDKLAAELRREVVVTKIGFKYIAEEILKGGVLLGGEESGGYSASGNIPDRDGILNSLYLCELAAQEQKPLEQIYADLEKRFGAHCYDRLDLQLDNALKEKARQTLEKDLPPDFLAKAVKNKEKFDGIKVHFTDESWILFRASGTEPLLRIYCEAASGAEVARLLQAAGQFVRQC
ncbi:MAG: phosphoglucomutase/phosphomannomutase family protein [Candidatus Margulisbacteria bacterium]|jgi:alpha-D-glucose phosphate-specific phosphoglucomutase|nr:phosphoglucomutase/phosphomannomutase family protein [Candidatus Margulisiibacteriota bacterium]